MMKVSYGIVGFFTGAFIGLLAGLAEMRFIDSVKHPTMLFMMIALTVIVFGIIGIKKGLNMAGKRMRK